MALVATTLRYPNRAEWVSATRCLTSDDPGLVRRVSRVARAARRGMGLVLDGSGRADQVAAAVASRLAPQTPVLLTDCTWSTGGSVLDRVLSRVGVRLLDRPNVTFSVGSQAEAEVFPRTWGIAPERVTHASWYHGVPDADPLDDVRHDGPVFAGGQSVRDYRPFLEAMALLRVPALVSAPDFALPGDVPVPPGVDVRELRPAAYDQALRSASVVVVPLQQRHDRAAGQSTYLTAMALGKLVIVTDSLGVREHVEDGVTGLVVDPTPEALADALRWALDPANTEAVERIRTAARAFVTTHYSPQRHIARLVELAGRLGATRVDARPRSRRVTMVEFPPAGGLFQFAVQLGEGLARRGHQVDVLTGPRPELASREPGCHIQPVLPTWHPHDEKPPPAWWRKLRRVVRAGQHVLAWVQVVAVLAIRRPDVVMWSAWRFPVDGWGVQVVRRVLPHARLVMVAHEPRPLVEQGGGDGAAYRDSGLLTRALAGAYAVVDHVYVLGEQTRQVFEETWPTRATVTVVPHGDERIYPADSVKPVTGTPPDVLTFGTITAYKGIDVLLEAWPHVTAQVPEATLRIVGPLSADIDAADLDRRARAVGAQVSTGYVAVEDVPSVFDPARVVALPYLRSSQSGVAHLAQTFRRPVVASRVGDIPAVVADGVTGLLVEPGDAVALAHALVTMLRDPDLAERLGEAGERLLTAGASWDEVAAAVDTVWGGR
ncbi:glycosyltransferase [Knoellia koreensis]|uniref:Glycosyltransferase family 4 protein n=1 Tax=Knoellia koreensis TaxID=2730921 RepID=A0A849HLD0_9MICO|nr:glycosyltransferase [Knoellia sp. DB2414S]NNM48142.1 glycosyltransferase family 4 protein [Knoellia sp. DB2414S]